MGAPNSTPFSTALLVQRDSLCNQLSLELGNTAEPIESQLASRGRRIDASLVQYDLVRAIAVKLLGDFV